MTGPPLKLRKKDGDKRKRGRKNHEPLPVKISILAYELSLWVKMSE